MVLKNKLIRLNEKSPYKDARALIYRKE